MESSRGVLVSSSILCLVPGYDGNIVTVAVYLVLDLCALRLNDALECHCNVLDVWYTYRRVQLVAVR